MTHDGMSTPEYFRHLAEQLPLPGAVTVLVVGDIMLDRFTYGDVDRISPESPVPILSVRRESTMPGGAGNVFSNLRSLGAQVRLAGVVGADEAGNTLRDFVLRAGSDPSGLITDAARPTTLKTRFIAGHQQLLRVDSEQTQPLPDAVSAALLDYVRHALQDGAQAIVLSDYGKGVLHPALIHAVIALARAADVPVLVDPKGRDYSIYKGATLVTPNRKELALATGDAPTGSDDEVTDAARRLIEQAGIQSVIATRSQDGMTILSAANAAPLHLRTEAVEVFDVSGAGDTVIATLAAMLCAGVTLADAAAAANIAAGLVVAKAGTASVTIEELRAALLRRGQASPSGSSDMPFQAPLCSSDEAMRQLAIWRSMGLKIGFTNGCFDILHMGHVRYLNMARTKCDRLVVGLNCDASVRRLKGETRPVNSEAARAAVLGALGAVDMVILFGQDAAEQDTPRALIETVRPDILIKGADYTVDTVVGADIVMGYGGEVWLAPIEEGHSTTSILKRLKAS